MEEDKGQLLKSFLYPGYPIHGGLTAQEATLRTVTQGLQLLRERLPTASAPSQPNVQVLPPQRQAPLVEINVPDPSITLAPHLNQLALGQDAMVRAQQDTARGMGVLAEQGRESIALEGAMSQDLSRQTQQGEVMVAQGSSMIQQGNMALRQRQDLVSQSRLAVHVLESLDESGRQAYIQRLALLGGLYQTREAIDQTRGAIERVGAQLGQGIDEVNSNLLGLREQGTVQIAELEKHTSLLDDIARLEHAGLKESKMQTRSLGSIDSGVHALVDVAQEHTGLLSDVRSELRSIGGQLDVLAVIAEKSQDHLAHMEGSLDAVVLVNRRISKALESVLEILKGPVRTKALDLWSIGEQCRKTGNMEDAFRKFSESRDENPAEPRNYHSLGMLCLEVAAVQAAEDFFIAGLQYARQKEPQLTAVFLLQLGRLAFLKQDYPKAKGLLDEALLLDKTNVDMWYELALVDVKLGNNDEALYYLRNLVHFARQKAPWYIEKIFHEKEFFAFLYSLNILEI